MTPSRIHWSSTPTSWSQRLENGGIGAVALRVSNRAELFRTALLVAIWSGVADCSCVPIGTLSVR